MVEQYVTESNDGNPTLADVYETREREATAEAEVIAARSRLISNFRGLSFGAFAIGLLVAIFGSAREAAGLVALIGGVAFLALIIVHQRVLDRENEARRRARVNHDGHLRVSNRFRELPQNGAEHKGTTHPYADDLDVFGPGSLFQRLCTAHTPYGRRTLAAWLSGPADQTTITERQEAIGALAPRLNERQRLEALALFAVDALATDGTKRAKAAPDPEPFVAWAESDPVLCERPLIVWGSRLVPPLTVTSLVMVVSFGVPVWAFTVPFFVQLVLLYQARQAVLRAFQAVSTSEGALARYGAMLEVIEKLDVDSGMMRRVQTRITAGGRPPSESMKSLGKRVGWFELRHNGLVHPFANSLLLWDIHCTLALETWQKVSGKQSRAWLVALGEVEALCSLAALAHDEPSFVFPDFTTEAAFEVEALGHPLIHAAQRVHNDVSLPKGGTALLVTGSNMSGKSTLLRAMGLATVMALAGAPVCASRLRTGRFAVRTSIRVSDSLEAGVSHFYAEVAKLKAVMTATEGDLPVLFLLDEILHGTNSRERQIGARWVLGELLERGATGAISTHDMELCRLPPRLMEKVTLVHFRENVKDGKMTFDFRIRSGPVTSGNALRLMQLVGLDVPLETEQDPQVSPGRSSPSPDPEA